MLSIYDLGLSLRAELVNKCQLVNNFQPNRSNLGKKYTMGARGWTQSGGEMTMGAGSRRRRSLFGRIWGGLCAAVEHYDIGLLKK